MATSSATKHRRDRQKVLELADLTTPSNQVHVTVVAARQARRCSPAHGREQTEFTVSSRPGGEKDQRLRSSADHTPYPPTTRSS